MTKLRLVWRDALALLFALRDPRTTGSARLLAVVALAYAVLPLDLLPDLTPWLGLADDLLVVPAILALATRQLPTPVQHQAVQRSREMQRRLPWLLPLIGVALLLTVSAAGWGLLHLLGAQG